MNIDFDYIVSLARHQARDAKNTCLYVDPQEFKMQLLTGKAGEEIHIAACNMLQQPLVEPADDFYGGGHYAVEEVIRQACIAINELKYNR